MAAAVSTTTAMLGRSLSRGILSRNAPALVSRSLVTRAGIHLEDRLSDSSARPAGRIHSRHERRYMGLMSRFSNLFSGSWTAEDMRELERAANSRPGDVTSQALFTHALLRQGFASEVVRRVSSGKFAVNLVVLEVYSRAIAAVRGLNEMQTKQLSGALSHAFASNGGFISADAIRNITSTEVGQSRDGSGGSGGRLSGGEWWQPSGSSSSASSSGAGASRGEDPYFGSSPTFSPGGQSGGGGGFGAGGGGSGVGSATNPLVVSVAPGRRSMFLTVVRIVGVGVSLAILYQLLFSKSGGLAGPLAQLTGDITEEVTDVPTTRFADVKGVDEAKQELEDIVAFLRDPEKFRRLGAKVPRGVLLTGPPGTGKTLLARAVAGEAGCKFYSKSASEFEEMLVGLGARRVRDLFAAARKNAPAIIFLDEIDALGGKRQKSIGSNSERQTLNQLLSCMDGFTKNENVIVIAATNSPDILDAALRRPGRFDSTVDVPLPDVKGRREIIDLYLSRVIVSPDVDAVLLARATPGFSGAQLEAMINSAALMAAQRGAARIETEDVEEARDKVIMGPAKKSRVQKAEIMRLTAYHESGHTMAALKTRGARDLHKVTILPRGASGGATYSLPKDEDMMTREAILAHIDVAMGGRVAEEIIFGHDQITTGAGSDMAQASQLARKYCMSYSMSDLGLTSYADGSEPSPERKAAIDTEVEKILQDSYARVRALLTANRKQLDTLATALIEFETLDAAEVNEVLQGRPLIPFRERLAAGRSSANGAPPGGSPVIVAGSKSPSTASVVSGPAATGGGSGPGAVKEKSGGRVGGIWAFTRLWEGSSSGDDAPHGSGGGGVTSPSNFNNVTSAPPSNFNSGVSGITSTTRIGGAGPRTQLE